MRRKKTKPPEPKENPVRESGDKCGMCGILTDYIMQSRNGPVCESCLESAESEENENY